MQKTTINPQQNAINKYRNLIQGILRGGWHTYPSDYGEARVKLTINNDGKIKWNFIKTSSNELCNLLIKKRMDYGQFPEFTDDMKLQSITFIIDYHREEGKVDIVSMTTSPELNNSNSE